MTTVLSKPSGYRTGGSGARVLRITVSSPFPPSAYAQHELILLAGKEYRLQGWLRSDSVNEFDLAIWSSRVDEGGADTEIFTLSGTAAWAQFDETFTPTHDSYLRFGGIYIEAPTGNFWFEYDDVTLWATEDVPTNPILYWTAGGDATLDKDLSEVYEGLQSLSVTADADDFSLQDVNLDERYATVSDAFVMFDGGSGVLRSRVLDPEPPA
jgi:hypothetical protein